MKGKEKEALDLLRSVWGHRSFRPGQWEVVRSIISGNDTLGILPTGTGKSVCYQLSGLLLGQTVIVVSPLIALMADQVDGLSVRGVAAVALNSSIPASKQERVWRDAAAGAYQFIYVSPELLNTVRFSKLISGLKIGFIAVDEAHCISEWGNSFRPMYRRITEAIPAPVPRLAVTATASPAVQREIKRILKLRKPVCVVTGYDRPNLYWCASKVQTVTAYVERIIESCEGSFVIYCMTRRSVEWWAEWLSLRMIPTSHYHGGMARRARAQSQSDWLCGRTRAMVATNAFGMGIDKSDVRLVLHIGLPSNLSAYYQEAGRAGRDGLPSRAALIYQAADLIVRRRLLSSGSRRAYYRVGRGRDQGVRRFAELLKYLESPTCRRRYILNYFGEAYSRSCGYCDRCVETHGADVWQLPTPRDQLPDSLRTDGDQFRPEEERNRMVKEDILEYSQDLSATRPTAIGERLNADAAD